MDKKKVDKEEAAIRERKRSKGNKGKNEKRKIKVMENKGYWS